MRPVEGQLLDGRLLHLHAGNLYVLRGRRGEDLFDGAYDLAPACVRLQPSIVKVFPEPV